VAHNRLYLAAILGLSWLTAVAATPKRKQPVDYVSPNIGGIGQLLTATVPFVQLPFGMARVSAATTPGVADRYLADRVYGYSFGAGILMASTGEVADEARDYSSDFDHDFETTTPYHHRLDFESWSTTGDCTATKQSALFRFGFPESDHAHISLSLGKEADVSILSPTALQGSQRITGTVATVTDLQHVTRLYFYLEFSRPMDSFQIWQPGHGLRIAKTFTGNEIGVVGTFRSKPNEVAEVRVGLSYISADQAKRNLDRDTRGKSFEMLEGNARSAWNEALGKIQISSTNDKQTTIFYTALWRSLQRMTDIAEDGRYYSGFDHAVHDAEGHDFYVDDGIWDTYRSLHPLQLLLDGHRQEDMIRSYLRMYQQSGWMPSFPSVAGEQAVMIGHHADQLILDTYRKGYTDFDLQLAYEAMRKNATEATLLPWRRGELMRLDRIYQKQGFFPALAWGQHESEPGLTERRQAVSVTLEAAYDDWAVGQVAQILNKAGDAELFTRRAFNYQNVWNPQTHFMSPKSEDGHWVDHFDPKLGGGQGGRDYTTEVNSWLYTFSVQQDPEGLIQLFGGRDSFNKRLDGLFAEQYGTSKFAFLGQFPDATGLVGLYAQGNEPSFHIPYLYDFSGEPWKAQKRIRQLLDVWYGEGPLGIPGDDDGGETSSWYVFSALGFYPECPGVPVYEIGSPLFARSSITLDNGKHFTVVADGVSAQNKYIQSSTMNGVPWTKPWFSHLDVMNGGTLVLKMGPKPNRAWGSSVKDVPPSLTSPR